MIQAIDGGSDPGAVARVKEADYNLSYALELGRVLKTFGLDVSYTRSTDRFVDLGGRAKIANDWGADYFVSIHFNAGGGTGIETYALSPGGQGDRLARSVHGFIIESTNAVNRGVKYANFQVLRQTDMPAILIELGFVDSNDADRIASELYKQQCVRGISKGICVYLGIPWQDPYTDSKPEPQVELVAPDMEFVPPSGDNIWPLPGGLGWVETLDRRLVIHLGRSTYISLEDGSITAHARGKEMVRLI